MMKYFQDALDYYSNKMFYNMLYSFIPKEGWGNRKTAEEYLKKYGLTNKEYEDYWKPIQDTIFINQHTSLPAMVFADPYHIIMLRGGALFTTHGFLMLQKCMLKVGDTHFVIIQQRQKEEEDCPPLYMRYPVTITLKELMSGNYISSVIFDIDLFTFYIFSNSGIWGKYVNTHPGAFHTVDLIGCKKKYISLFQNAFSVSPAEEEKIWNEWGPPSYKPRLISTANKKEPETSAQEQYDILEFYSNENYLLPPLKAVLSQDQWDNVKGAKQYLKKYWLDPQEYEAVWKPIENIIFATYFDEAAPASPFPVDYNLISLKQGKYFNKERLEFVKTLLSLTGESYFVIIQEDEAGFIKHPLFQLKYPASITCEDFKADNFIATIIYEMCDIYILYSMSTVWGVRLGETSSLLGFKKEHTAFFKEIASTAINKEVKVWTQEEWNNYLKSR